MRAVAAWPGGAGAERRARAGSGGGDGAGRRRRRVRRRARDRRARGRRASASAGFGQPLPSPRPASSRPASPEAARGLLCSAAGEVDGGVGLLCSAGEGAPPMAAAPRASPGRDPAGAGSAAGLRGRRRGDGTASRSAGGRRARRRRPSPAATRRKAMAFLCSSDELGLLCPWNAQDVSRRRPHGRAGGAGRRRQAAALPRVREGGRKHGGWRGDAFASPTVRDNNKKTLF